MNWFVIAIILIPRELDSARIHYHKCTRDYFSRKLMYFFLNLHLHKFTMSHEIPILFYFQLPLFYEKPEGGSINHRMPLNCFWRFTPGIFIQLIDIQRTCSLHFPFTGPLSETIGFYKYNFLIVNPLGPIYTGMFQFEISLSKYYLIYLFIFM